MAFTRVWNDATPADSQLASLGAQDFRYLKVDVQQRMAAISGLDAAKPAFGSDDTPANWTGILFFATDTGAIYQWNGTAWVGVSMGAGKFSGSCPTGVTSPLLIPASAILAGTVLEIFSTYGNTANPSSTVPDLTISSVSTGFSQTLVGPATALPPAKQVAFSSRVVFTAVGASGNLGALSYCVSGDVATAVQTVLTYAIDTTSGVSIYVTGGTLVHHAVCIINVLDFY